MRRAIGATGTRTKPEHFFRARGRDRVVRQVRMCLLQTAQQQQRLQRDCASVRDISTYIKRAALFALPRSPAHTAYMSGAEKEVECDFHI